jgi:hypothetical protein
MATDEFDKVIDAEAAELEALAAARPITTETLARYETLRHQLVSHERQLCLARQREVVMPLTSWSARWTQSHTDVRLVARQSCAWLAFESLSEASKRRAALWEFEAAEASRLTAIDYDNLEQHPLFHSGLEGLGAYTVENSTWVAQQAGTFQQPKRIHYLFCFNSCLVECIARAVKAVCEADSVAGVWQRVPRE